MAAQVKLIKDPSSLLFLPSLKCHSLSFPKPGVPLLDSLPPRKKALG